MLYYILGIITGLLIRRYDSSEKLQELRQRLPLVREKTQFIQPISDKEKFNQANNIDDMLK